MSTSSGPGQSSTMTEDEADRQFREDLEVAKAISMESQAWEELRLKNYGKKPCSRAHHGSNNNNNIADPFASAPKPRRSNYEQVNLPARALDHQASVLRRGSTDELKPRPRPSTTTKNEILQAPKVLPPRQLSLISPMPTTRPAAMTAPQAEEKPQQTGDRNLMSDDLISWKNPAKTKCDEFKSNLSELYRVSANPAAYPVRNVVHGSAPITPNFNFASSLPGSQVSTPIHEQPAGHFLQPRTVFPTRNKLNRYEYSRTLSPTGHQSLYPGIPASTSFSHSPTSLDPLPASVFYQGFGSMVKSQSLSAFPQLGPSSNAGGGDSLKTAPSGLFSVSAHTSPVHQINQPSMTMNRVSNPNYSLVVPRSSRQSEAPEPSVTPTNGSSIKRSTFDILPNKPKIESLNSTLVQKRAPGNLIDFSEDERKSRDLRFITKVSVKEACEAFDPLLLSDEDDDIPLTDSKPAAAETEAAAENVYFASNASEGSFYESYDPFEYMVHKAQTQKEDEIVDDQDVQQETPIEDHFDGTGFLMSPRHKKNRHIVQPSTVGVADEKTVERRKKEKEKFYEKTEVIMGKVYLHKETDASKVDPEVRAFVDMVANLRSNFKYTSKGNLGIILSPKIRTVYPNGTSVKLVVRPLSSIEDAKNLPDVKFTCDVIASMEHVLWKALMDLEEKGLPVNKDDAYVFSVSGADEYILCDDSSKLEDYDYVHRCYKFDSDVELTLVPNNQLKRPLSRTNDDDVRDSVVLARDVSPADTLKTLSYDELRILMETLEKEATRMSGNAVHIAGCTEKAVMTALRPKNVVQAVKLICTLLGKVETVEVTELCERLCDQCRAFDQERSNESDTTLRPAIVDEESTGDKYVKIALKPVRTKNFADQIQATLTGIKEVIQKLVEVYTKSFRVDFSFGGNSIDHRKVSTIGEEFRPRPSHEVLETLLLRVSALHRPQPEWTYEEYMISLEVYHGTRPITESLESPWRSITESFYDRVVFDNWIEIIRICSLPREARLVLNLFGRKNVIVDKQTRSVKTDIGWAALQLFSFERFLVQGSFLLPIWPSAETEKQVGPAPDCGSHPNADTCPLISIELPELTNPVIFPQEIPLQLPPRKDYNFKDLDFETQEQLLDLCSLDIMSFSTSRQQEREVFWEKRYYMTDIPGALPKVLLAAHSWDYACLPSLYGLIQQWHRPDPMDILQLFLPCFPDTHVRQVAIEWLRNVPNDDLNDFLPQLVEALKHETWSASPLAKLLLERALQCPRIAHSLYWLLTQSLPGQSPQNTSVGEADAGVIDAISRVKMGRYKRRLQMLMRALIHISGQALRNAFLKEQELVKLLHDAAVDVKQSKDAIRSAVLVNRLNQLNEHLRDASQTLIPLSPGLVVCQVDPRASSYFPSNTLPLKLAFLAENGGRIPAIYKVGDDLRQDQLTIQMIRVMDKLWLREGLDLKMVTFACVPTGYRHGMVELVTEAKTLREIQVIGSGRGVTGSFKDTPIFEWLIKHNPSELEFDAAVNNFTRSCAGYSIATYVLGICDRHNDNIMVKQSGHLFHIDFGKFLGDAQMFGNFKRDRTAFVLTPDMLHVINRGDRPTQKFQDFVDLCCKGFNLVRKNGNLLLNLFTLMASSGIPGVTVDAVSYVQRALLPDLSDTEAAATFARLIEESLSSWFTQFNFFVHNLAQIRFSESTEDDFDNATNTDGDNNNKRKKSVIGGGGELLSFVPKKYSIKSDGRIEAVQVYGIQKRYRPEKHYVFILKITREHEKEATFLFRTYKEFFELYSKLKYLYPKVGLHSLGKGGLHLGRQEIQEVAERRKHDIASFLDVLFQLDESISHSDLVYTFFHPLFRDQEETNVHIRKLREQQTRNRSNGQIKGQIKLSLEYRRDTFMVMICHAKDLAVPDVSKEEPNSYVKVYLQPDPAKVTKRKTRVIHKNCHPSFMEMLEYRMPWEAVRGKTLQASIWNTDRFQENLFLGAVEITLEDLDLKDKCVEGWYSLTNYKRFSGNGRTSVARQ